MVSDDHKRRRESHWYTQTQTHFLPFALSLCDCCCLRALMMTEESLAKKKKEGEEEMAGRRSKAITDTSPSRGIEENEKEKQKGDTILAYALTFGG